MKFFHFKKFRKKGKSEDLIVEEINEKLGVVISGLSDLNKVTDLQVDRIKECLLKHHIVKINGARKLTEAEQIVFTEKFGTIEDPPIYIIPPWRINNGLNSKKTIKRGNMLWNSENSYKKRPAYLTVLQMIEMPEKKIETSFASLIDLYNSLPRKLKKNWKNYLVNYQDNVSHPLFWKHPFTGKATIYFDISFVTKVKDDCADEKELSIKRTNEIFEYIHEKLNNTQSFFTHKWKNGDIIILDNYAVAKRTNFPLEDEKCALLSTSTKGIYF